MSLKFLYLNEPDMIKAGVMDMKKCVQSMDDMFQVMGQGDYLMGSPSENHHGMMLWFPEEKRSEKMPMAGPDRRFMAMPAYVGGRFNVCGNKWYGSNIENQKKGLPRSILTVMLNDPDTGAPLALMSANLLSSMRTGAAMFSREALLKHSVVFDNWKMHKDWLDELRHDPERLLGVNAGHPSAKLLLMVARGEVDANHMVSFGDVLAKPEELGRRSDEDVFIFLTGGMGTEDTAWGFDVYQEALRQGIGQELTLWDKPHWA